MYQPTNEELANAFRSFYESQKEDMTDSRELATFLGHNPLIVQMMNRAGTNILHSLEANPEIFPATLYALFAAGFAIGQEVLHNASNQVSLVN